MATVVSPETSGEEGEFSCSGDVDSSFVSSQFQHGWKHVEFLLGPACTMPYQSLQFIGKV